MVERTSYPDGEPCWADVVAPDIEAGQRFYRALFGWEFLAGSPEFGGYAMAVVDSKPIAGITPPPPGAEAAPGTWSLYLASSDVAATAAKIDRGGGKVTLGPMEIPGSGHMLAATDPTGVGFGVWQAGGHPGAVLTGEPNTPLWAEVHTRDAAVTDTFYGSLFDYRQEQIGDGASFDYTVWSIGDRPVTGRIRQGPPAPAQWLVYFAVDGTDAAVGRATAAGGKVHMGPADTPRGRLAILTDPFGAAFSVLDPSRATGR